MEISDQLIDSLVRRNPNWSSDISPIGWEQKISKSFPERVREKERGLMPPRKVLQTITSKLATYKGEQRLKMGSRERNTERGVKSKQALCESAEVWGQLLFTRLRNGASPISVNPHFLTSS